MDTALKAATDGSIELPGDVCSTKDKNAFTVVANTIHLHENLGFDAARCLGLAFASWAAEGVDFVDKDYGGLVFAGHVEEKLDQSGL
jgi:hypothetical protein